MFRIIGLDRLAAATGVVLCLGLVLVAVARAQPPAPLPSEVAPLTPNIPVLPPVPEPADQSGALFGSVLHGRGGIAVEYVYTGEVFTNMRGGLNTNQATEYRGNFDLVLSADLDEMGLCPGGTIFLYGQNGHGKGITLDHVGDWQVLSNFDAHDFMQMSEYWWHRPLCSGNVELLLGKQDANRVFASVETAGTFINSSFGFHPTIPMPTFPDPSMAAVGLIHFGESISFNAGIWDGAASGGSWGFSGTGVTFSACEVDYRYALGNSKQLPGTFHVGPWYHSDQWDDLTDGSNVTYEGNYGVHVEMEQALYRECICDPENTEGLGAFVQYGWSPADRNIPHKYFGAGLVYEGLFRSRDEDLLGLGVAHLIFSDRLPDKPAETAVELFYRAQFRPWVFVQPDLQYIASPFENGRDALVFGLRFEMVL